MKYFKDSKGVVFAYEADGSQDEWIKTDLVAMTEVEIAAHLNPVITQEQFAQCVTAERDRRIDAGVLFQGVLYQSQAGDRENIAGAAQLAFMAIIANGAQPGDYRWQNPTEDFVWIADDNSRVPMDAPTVVEFGKVAAAWKSAHVRAARDLKDRAVVPDDYTNNSYWPTQGV